MLGFELKSEDYCKQIEESIRKRDETILKSEERITQIRNEATILITEHELTMRDMM